MDRNAREQFEKDFMRLMSGCAQDARPARSQPAQKKAEAAQPLWKFFSARSGERPLTFCRGRQGTF